MYYTSYNLQLQAKKLLHLIFFRQSAATCIYFSFNRLLSDLLLLYDQWFLWNDSAAHTQKKPEDFRFPCWSDYARFPQERIWHHRGRHFSGNPAADGIFPSAPHHFPARSEGTDLCPGGSPARFPHRERYSSMSSADVLLSRRRSENSGSAWLLSPPKTHEASAHDPYAYSYIPAACLFSFLSFFQYMHYFSFLPYFSASDKS